MPFLFNLREREKEREKVDLCLKMGYGNVVSSLWQCFSLIRKTISWYNHSFKKTKKCGDETSREDKMINFSKQINIGERERERERERKGKKLPVFLVVIVLGKKK